MRERPALSWFTLARTALRRTLADRALALAALALLLAATTLLTTGTLYADAVALGGVRAAIADAPIIDRRVTVGVAVPVADIRAADAAVADAAASILEAAGGGGLVRAAASESLAIGDRAAKRLGVLAVRPGIADHARLVEGRWAAEGAALEATISVRAADALGVDVGDVVRLARPSDAGSPIDVRVTGRWEPADDDPYWAGWALDLAGTQTRGGFTTSGPLVVPSVAALAAVLPRISLEWRVEPEVGAIRVEAVDALAVAVGSFGDRLDAAMPAGVQPRVATDLPRILARVDRSVLVSRSGVLVLVLEFAVVAAYAVVLVAGLLSDRRRARSALIRSRGGSSAQLGYLALVEAIALAGIAALAAPVLSLAVVRLLGGSGPLADSGVVDTIRLTPAALAADLATAIAGVVAMTVPALGGGPIAGVRALLARQGGRTLAQRLGIDLALVVVAVVALWQLRLYGAPITRNARGVLGVDPLLVAAPAIGLLAGAVLATRLIPRLAEVGERLLSRGRGLVGSLGGRALARRPLRSTRAALLLMLAAALGTFATSHVATWARSQADQAAYRVGADVRWTPSADAGPPSAIGTALRGDPAVLAAMTVDRLSLDAGRSVRGAVALAVDAKSAPSIVVTTPDADGAARAGLLDLLAAGRPTANGLAIPGMPRRIAVIIDAAIEELPPEAAGTTSSLDIAVTFVDADGRIHRRQGGGATLIGSGQRVEIVLFPGPDGTAAASAGPAGARLLSIEVAPHVTGLAATGLGTFAVTGLLASDAASGGAWTSIAAFRPADVIVDWTGGRGITSVFRPAPGTATIVLGNEPGDVAPAFPFTDVRIRLLPVRIAAPGPIPAIASARFLELTAASVGDVVPVTIEGQRLQLAIVGRTDGFPTLDPAAPFIVADGPSLAAARWAAIGSAADPREWWVATGDPATVAATISSLDPSGTVLVRPAVAKALREDPVALGVIGVLGLGSLAAMVFAAIGFLVSATVSTAERAGELALLRALGVSQGQVSAWLSIEHAFLLVVGLGTGIGLGALLAWLVLPFAALTGTGAPAVPSPVVTIPVAGLVPTLALGVGLLLATLVVLRVQLAGVRVGDVLRARDE